MAVAQNPLEAFIWGAGGSKKTPEEIARDKEIAAELLMKAGNTSPVQHWTQGAARVADALSGVIKQKRAERAGEENATYNQGILSELFKGSTAQPSATPMASASIPASGASSEIPLGEAAQQMAAISPRNDPVQDVLDAGKPSDGEYIRYTNQGATRSQPLNDKLVSALGFLPELGVQMEVFSGGQAGIGEGGPRTGSTRHDHGNSADVFFVKDGRRLNWANENDRPIFEEIVKRGKASGITGFGAGDGYMQPGSMHLGFGNPSVWGAGGKGANAPAWLRNAYNSLAPAEIASADPQDAIQAVSPTQRGSLSIYPGQQPTEQPAMAAQPTPVQQVAQALPAAGQTQQAVPGMSEALLRAISDPRATPQTRAVAQALMQQQAAQQAQAAEQQQWMARQQYEQAQQQNDPLRRQQLEMGQIELQKARNPQPGFRTLTTEEKTQLGLPPNGAFQAGADGKISQIGGGGVTVNNEGSIPAGYQAIRDAEGRVTSIQPIPGSPAALEMEQAVKTKENQGSRKDVATDVITNAASNARQILKDGWMTTGTPGRIAANVSESPAAELRRQIGVLKSQATIETLSAMRQASPTGGAMGAVSDKEGEMLAAAAGAIDPNADKADVEKALDNYEHTLLRVIHGPKVGDAIFEQTRVDPNVVPTDIPNVVIKRKAKP